MEVATDDPVAQNQVVERVTAAIAETLGVRGHGRAAGAGHPAPGRLQGQTGGRSGLSPSEWATPSYRSWAMTSWPKAARVSGGAKSVNQV